LVTYFGLPYLEIVKRFHDLYGVDGDVYLQVNKNLSSLKTERLQLDDVSEEGEEKVEIDIPPETIRLNKEITFTKRRKIPFSIVKKFKIGVCNSGFYENRLIIPITTGKNKSFIAYSLYNKSTLKKWAELSKQFPDNKLFERNKKKILNPKSALHSMLLYNYDFIKPNPKILFVHEGFIDVVRTTVHGFDSVGLGKKRISEYQAILIDKLSPKEVCLMLDSDVSKEDIQKGIDMLKENCECSISYVKLKGGDPDDIKTRSDFEKIIKKRKQQLFSTKTAKLL
jgi:hypothetical protein